MKRDSSGLREPAAGGVRGCDCVSRPDGISRCLAVSSVRPRTVGGTGADSGTARGHGPPEHVAIIASTSSSCGQGSPGQGAKTVFVQGRKRLESFITNALLSRQNGVGMSDSYRHHRGGPRRSAATGTRSMVGHTCSRPSTSDRRAAAAKGRTLPDNRRGAPPGPPHGIALPCLLTSANPASRRHSPL